MHAKAFSFSLSKYSPLWQKCELFYHVTLIAVDLSNNGWHTRSRASSFFLVFENFHTLLLDATDNIKNNDTISI